MTTAQTNVTMAAAQTNVTVSTSRANVTVWYVIDNWLPFGSTTDISPALNTPYKLEGEAASVAFCLHLCEAQPICVGVAIDKPAAECHLKKTFGHWMANGLKTFYIPHRPNAKLPNLMMVPGMPSPVMDPAVLGPLLLSPALSPIPANASTDPSISNSTSGPGRDSSNTFQNVTESNFATSNNLPKMLLFITLSLIFLLL